MEERKIRIEPLSPESNFADDEGRWLVNCAAEHLGAGGACYALIHLDDGVLWGRIDRHRLIVPSQSNWTPELRSLAVQQCRVFGEKGELFILRESEGRWSGRVVIEDEAGYEAIDEPQILNGRRVFGDENHLPPPAPSGFTPIFEPDTGIRQIVPVVVTANDFNQDKRVMLTVRHYLTADDDGQAGFFCSRLKDINVTKA